MYRENESVLYGLQGVCKIIEIVKKNFDHKVVEYYVLQPVYDDNATIFIPTQNEKLTAKMRPVHSVQEIYALIKEMPEQEPIWIEEESVRREKYQEILAEGDCRKLIRMIKALYSYQKQLQEKGKKMHLSDERFLKDAEKTLHDEFAHVLQIQRDEVLPLIMEKVQPHDRKEGGNA